MQSKEPAIQSGPDNFSRCTARSSHWPAPPGRACAYLVPPPRSVTVGAPFPTRAPTSFGASGLGRERANPCCATERCPGHADADPPARRGPGGAPGLVADGSRAGQVKVTRSPCG